MDDGLHFWFLVGGFCLLLLVTGEGGVLIKRRDDLFDLGRCHVFAFGDEVIKGVGVVWCLFVIWVWLCKAEASFE